MPRWGPCLKRCSRPAGPRACRSSAPRPADCCGCSWRRWPRSASWKSARRSVSRRCGWPARCPRGGRIDTIAPDRSRTDRSRRYWLRAGVTDRVRVINEPALRVIPRLAPGIEFAFIDAITTEYLAYLDALLPKMAPGGMITVDNVLWSGRIAAGVHDEDTDALRAFNERFLRHEQLEATIVPVGDGLGIGVVRPHGS